MNAKERMEKKIKRRGSKVRTCQGRDEKRIRNKIQREEKGKKRMKETVNCIIVFFLLDGSPASEFYVPTFRNTVFQLHRRGTPPMNRLKTTPVLSNPDLSKTWSYCFLNPEKDTNLFFFPKKKQVNLSY